PFWACHTVGVTKLNRDAHYVGISLVSGYWITKRWFDVPRENAEAEDRSTSSASRSPAISRRNEARAFWQMRGRIVRCLICQALEQSRLRLLLFAISSGLLWGGMFWLAIDGFHFLQTAIPDPAAFGGTVRSLFSVFFAGLMLMLTFSSAVLLHGFLFRAADLTFLLTAPARVERVFLHKFQEAVFFSSWAFLLLATPMLLAHGIVESAPWYYYVMLPAFLIAFTYIPAGVAAIACLLVAYRLSRGRVVLMVAVGAIAAVAAIWLLFDAFTATRSGLFTSGWFKDVLLRLRLSNHQLLPSWWLSSGLIESAQGGWNESVLFLSLIISNALLLRQLAVYTAARVYRRAFSELQGRRSTTTLGKTPWLDRLLLRFRPIPVHFRVLLLKDFRIFRRDTLQYSQFLVFFALLAVYFLNIRRFSDGVNHPGWHNMIGLMNVAVVGLILSTLTTRFIFPMVSLEAQRFWIMGLMPLGRRIVPRSIFFFSAAGTILPCAVLIALSDYMLDVSLVIRTVHQLTGVLICLGLSGIAVGLGAHMPVLTQPSSSRIAAGFGGTLNLVLSGAYILAIVFLIAVPSHFHQMAHATSLANMLGNQTNVLGWLYFWLIAGSAASILLAAVAIWFPMRLGMRAFEKMDF
ncbi:MAG: hypothetical protein U9N87_09555, partial [Planctomycetota bacterium]|nr:hypothetical protein [Planctomycetota bacterium]